MITALLIVLIVEVALAILILLALARRAFTRPPAPRWDANALAAFLSVGRFSLDDWIALDDESREAIARVARILKADEMHTLAEAVRDPKASAEVYALVDNGERSRKVLMHEALSRTARRFSRGAGRAPERSRRP